VGRYRGLIRPVVSELSRKESLEQSFGVISRSHGAKVRYVGVAQSLAGGIFSVGHANPAAGVFSSGAMGLAAVVLSLGASFPLGVLPAGGGAGSSALPKMTGSPSLPLPMTTIFEFVDCDN
jgi:hypothetical protein